MIETTCRVVTWNGWGRYGDWSARVDGIIAELKRSAPDIVCLQEAWTSPKQSEADLVGEALGLSHAYHDLAARLQTWADAHGKDASAARLRLAYERLLARMHAASPLQWVVRGGRAIDLRFNGRARRTVDLDVSVADTTLIGLTELRQLLSEVCQTDLGDGWSITLTRLQRSVVEDIGVVGFKAWLAARYDAWPFEEFSFDVSKAYTATIRPEVLSVLQMLGDARLRGGGSS